MKKILLLTLSFILVQTYAQAKNVKVEALSAFSTANPPQTWQVKTMEDIQVKGKGTLPTGSIITGRIEDIKAPSRGKRNAKFTFVPISINIEGQEYEVHKEVVGQYSSMTDYTPDKIMEKGAIAAGNKLVNGLFGPSVALVKGAVKNEEGNRAKSAAVSLYESTPLSYINKGKELEIPEGYKFIMSFKNQKD